jgi:hypothetical protein
VMFVIMLMFLLLFRSLAIAMICIIPNAIAAAFVLGIMGWLGIPLDIMTITIAAISVGIGVDNTIHYMHRFRREYPRFGNYRQTMFYCHNSIGCDVFHLHDDCCWILDFGAVQFYPDNCVWPANEPCDACRAHRFAYAAPSTIDCV